MRERIPSCFVIVSRALMGITLAQFTHFGVDPKAKRALIAKGVHSPRPAFESIAERFIFVNSPGPTAADVTSLKYSNRRYPLYPFEATA